MKLTPEEREQLENEQLEGRKAKQLHEAYVEQFCQAKRESLFMAFSELPLSAKKEIMEVKRMLFAVDTLEAELISKIQTGQMASKALEAAEPKEVH